jgi:transcriptional regulator with XRE-family HTH domain
MAKATAVEVPYLRAWRLERLLTQGQLAELAGVGRSSITAAENGGRLGLLTISRLAKALGISRTQLLREDPERGTPPTA